MPAQWAPTTRDDVAEYLAEARQMHWRARAN
jgi:hypothetical protein